MAYNELPRTVEKKSRKEKIRFMQGNRTGLGKQTREFFFSKTVKYSFLLYLLS